MKSHKDILVVTTSTLDGIVVKRYLKPVSSHVVAGTNLFNDFLGGLSDVFGGRSETYQKQLSSLYNEAMERIKSAAFEIGGNCILGLSIDLDEISGKGKSMFMLTAVGTAVIIEQQQGLGNSDVLPLETERLENVGVERLNILRRKKTIIDHAKNGNLDLNENVWSFITDNQVYSVAPYLLKKFSEALIYSETDTAANFQRQLTAYIDTLSHTDKVDLLYNGIQTQDDEKLISRLADIVNELSLFDFARCMELLKSEKFQRQKLGIQIARYDKPFYNFHDIANLESMRDFINQTFVERGSRIMKKQLLSSKEKEAWICECSKTNEIGDTCSACQKDIYGFKSNETKPAAAESYILQKIELIKESVHI